MRAGFCWKGGEQAAASFWSYNIDHTETIHPVDMITSEQCGFERKSDLKRANFCTIKGPGLGAFSIMTDL